MSVQVPADQGVPGRSPDGVEVSSGSRSSYGGRRSPGSAGLANGRTPGHRIRVPKAAELVAAELRRSTGMPPT
jgi:hypothetical protein